MEEMKKSIEEKTLASWSSYLTTLEHALVQMEKSIEEMQKEVQSGRLGTEADASFHMAIAYATKNPVHTYIMKNFHDFLFVGIQENLRMLYEDPKNIEDVLEQHRKVFNAIRRRDPEMAFSAMKMHIRYVMLFFRDHSRMDLLDKIRVTEP